MKSRKLGIILTAFLFVVATGAAGLMSSDAFLMDDAKMKVQYDSDAEKWFVITDKGKKEPARGKKGYDVEWRAVGSAMTFTFPEELKNHLQRKTGNYDPVTGKATVRRNKKFKVRVLDSAPEKAFEYEVYVEKDGSYAEGTSPPVIIIGGR